MNGTILLTAFSSDFDITPSQTPEGKPYPETILTVTLSGTNQGGEGPRILILRFRDEEKLSSNPTVSGPNILIDLSKTDFEMVKDLINKSILATENPLQLQANYTTNNGSTRVNMSLR